jgi:hypothetical protein
VLVSTDCGASFTSLYKKWGSSLITHPGRLTSSFIPTASEWRKDSVNLTSYIGDSILLAFVNTTENENNIYLDDINLYNVTINNNLKAKGFMISPNPTSGVVSVQFYPNPPYIKSITIFNSHGHRVAMKVINGAGSSTYNFNLGQFASGVYFLQVALGDRVITNKLIKQ